MKRSLKLFFVERWKHRKKLVGHLLGPLPAVVAILKLPSVLLEVLPRNVDMGPADRVLEP
jgi:hypothetical protein